MRVKIVTEVQLADDEANRIFRRKLHALTEQPAHWVKNGKVWQDDPEWRHGSVSEEEVKLSKTELPKRIAYLKWRAKLADAAQTLIDTLNAEPKTKEKEQFDD